MMKEDLYQLDNEHRKLLSKRTQELALDRTESRQEQSQLKIVEFILNHEHYAIPNGSIWTIVNNKQICPIPCTPPQVIGVINHHGEIISVNDLSLLFNLPAQSISDQSYIIIISNQTQKLGLLVEDIVDSKEVPASLFCPKPPHLSRQGKHYLSALSSDGIGLIDPEKILTDTSLIVNESYS